MANEPSISSLTLDGVLLQYAGELLLDSKLTTAHRLRFRDTYVKSLSSLAYAILFHENLVTSGKIADTISDGDKDKAETNPALYLTQQILSPFFQKNDLAQPVHVTSDIPANPADLLKEEMHREEIGKYLDYLGPSFARDPTSWENLLIREALIFMGSDESILKDQNTPDVYEFGKKPKYITHDGLQAQINNTPSRIVGLNFVDYLARVLDKEFSQRQSSSRRERSMPTKPSMGALREFVSRVTLTHLVIHHWYQAKGANRSHYNLTHSTRGGVDLARITAEIAQKQNINGNIPGGKDAKTDYESRIGFELLKETVTRHGLFEALQNRNARNRETLLKVLIDMRSEKPYKSLRAMLVRMDELTGKNPGKLRAQVTKINQEIEKINQPGEKKTENIMIVFNYFTDLNPVGWSRRRILRPIVTGFPRSEEIHYNSRLEEVFPELRMSSGSAEAELFRNSQ